MQPDSTLARLGSVLFWSVIAAAFIGPGTVATAAAAGAGYGYALLWALVFSTIACLALQEASARLTLVSGRNLGQALRGEPGVTDGAVVVLVLGAVVVGCAAYQTGNILGGVEGAALGTGLPRRGLTLGSAVLAALLLWFGRPGTVARWLSLFVAVMGAAFLVTAWMLGPGIAEMLRGALVPRLPSGSGLIVLGLVGTTVVPYNLFLGSGLARGQSLGEMRFGLSVAVIAGGLISAAIVVVGGAVEGTFSFEALSRVLEGRLGSGARLMFAAGLWAAGTSSAITAPLAAAITARSILARGEEERWSDRSPRYRGVWISVLAVGVLFGLLEVRPIPAILFAQALNGILLPTVAVFLLLAVNDRRLMGSARINGWPANALLLVVVSIALLLGVSGVIRAAAAVFGQPRPGPGPELAGALVVWAVGALPVGRALMRRRRG